MSGPNSPTGSQGDHVVNFGSGLAGDDQITTPDDSSSNSILSRLGNAHNALSRRQIYASFVLAAVLASWFTRTGLNGEREYQKSLGSCEDVCDKPTDPDIAVQCGAIENDTWEEVCKGYARGTSEPKAADDNIGHITRYVMLSGLAAFIVAYYSGEFMNGLSQAKERAKKDEFNEKSTWRHFVDVIVDGTKNLGTWGRHASIASAWATAGFMEAFYFALVEHNKELAGQFKYDPTSGVPEIQQQYSYDAQAGQEAGHTANWLLTTTAGLGIISVLFGVGSRVLRKGVTRSPNEGEESQLLRVGAPQGHYGSTNGEGEAAASSPSRPSMWTSLTSCVSSCFNCFRSNGQPTSGYNDNGPNVNNPEDFDSIRRDAAAAVQQNADGQLPLNDGDGGTPADDAQHPETVINNMGNGGS